MWSLKCCCVPVFMTHLHQAGCNSSMLPCAQTRSCFFTCHVHATKPSCQCACLSLRHHSCCRLGWETEIAHIYTEVAQPYTEVGQHGIYCALLLMRLVCMIGPMVTVGPSALKSNEWMSDCRAVKSGLLSKRPSCKWSICGLSGARAPGPFCSAPWLVSCPCHQ